MRATWWSLIVSLACGPAAASCRTDVLPDVPRRIVGDRVWVNNVAMSIAELPSMRSIEAKARFVDFWQREGREVRTQLSNGVEVTSRFEAGCLYALQVPLGNGSHLPARLVVSDLRQGSPKTPRSFDWPPAAEGQVLTDTVSEDQRRTGRLLTYYVEKTPALAANQCLLRLMHGGWTLGTITKVLGSNYAFSARKGDASVDVSVLKETSGAVVTLNFSEVAG